MGRAGPRKLASRRTDSRGLTAVDDLMSVYLHSACKEMERQRG